MKDNCFTEFCCFLSNLNMNQPYVYIYPLPFEPPSHLHMLAWEAREAIVVASPPTHDSAVSPCFHGCRAFLHRLFPPQSPPSHPLNPPLRSQQQPSSDCSAILKLQLLAAALSRGPASLSGECMAAARTFWFSFHRCEWEQAQISCFTPSLRCFSSDSDSCPDVGVRPLLQFPQTPRAPPVLLTLLFIPLVPSSSWVLHGSIYFPLVRYSYSWCSACTSVSEGVFLIWNFFLKNVNSIQKD